MVNLNWFSGCLLEGQKTVNWKSCETDWVASWTLVLHWLNHKLKVSADSWYSIERRAYFTILTLYSVTWQTFWFPPSLYWIMSFFESFSDDRNLKIWERRILRIHYFIFSNAESAFRHLCLVTGISGECQIVNNVNIICLERTATRRIFKSVG